MQGVDAGSGTGSAPEASVQVVQLTSENKVLKQEKLALEHQVAQLSLELSNLKLTQPGEHEVSQQPQAPDTEEISEEAARKRLERLCKRNSQGMLCFHMVCSVSVYDCFSKKHWMYPRFPNSLLYI